MVARSVVDVGCPVIHVNMLDLHSSRRDRVRYEEVIQLFVVLVEDIRISLDIRDASHLIDFIEDIVECSKHGSCHDELVAVSPYDDVRVRVLLEDGVDESL